jgi:hypothetical protein
MFPFVKTLQILNRHPTLGFSPKQFNRCILRKFLALTNVRTLEIEGLDIPPTLRWLCRGGPDTYSPFILPLLGWLEVLEWTRLGLFQDMAYLFGRFKFTCLTLLKASDTRFLLHACAKTLWEPQLHPNDPHASEQFTLKRVRSPANGLKAQSSLEDFDLSRNQSLWLLHVPTYSFNESVDCQSSWDDCPCNSRVVKRRTIYGIGILAIKLRCTTSYSNYCPRYNRSSI